MNKIYHSIDQIHMDNATKQSIRSSIKEIYEKADTPPVKMCWKTPWRAVAACLVIMAALGISTAVAQAVFDFDLNKNFQACFGLNDQKEKELQEEHIIQNPKISDEHDGITIEAEKVISTGQECYVWLKITAPEDKCPLTHPMFFDSYYARQNGKSVEGYNISYVYSSQNSTDSSDTWRNIVWEPEKGITYFELIFDVAKGEETWDGSTLEMDFSSICYNEDETGNDSVWQLEIPVESSSQIKEYSMEYICPLTDETGIERTGTQEITITKITLRPFSICIAFDCPEKWKNDPDAAAVPVIGHISGYEKQDGSIVRFNFDEYRYPNIEIKEDGTCEMFEMYFDFMDMEDISAIYLDKQRIPLK